MSIPSWQHRLLAFFVSTTVAMSCILAAEDAAPRPAKATPAAAGKSRLAPSNSELMVRDVEGGRAFMERLKEENPRQYERLLDLHRSNRREYLRELQELVRQRQGAGAKVIRGRGESAAEAECNSLAERFHQAEAEEEKARLKAELETAVQAAFEVRLRESKERIERLEKQLDKFRERIQQLEENRDKIVRTRMEELTRPPELNWNGRW